MCNTQYINETTKRKETFVDAASITQNRLKLNKATFGIILSRASTNVINQPTVNQYQK